MKSSITYRQAIEWLADTSWNSWGAIRMWVELTGRSEETIRNDIEWARKKRQEKIAKLKQGNPNGR